MSSLVQDTTCWVCGRTAAEIRKSITGKTDEELEIEGKMARAKADKTHYAKKHHEWAKVDDPRFYGPFQALSKARSEMGGPTVHFGELELGRQRRGYLGTELEWFERKTGTTLWWHSDGSGFSNSPDERLRDKTPEERRVIGKMAADLFYEAQLKLLKERLDEARSRRPEWGIKMMKMPRQVASVALCDICGALMGGLRPVEAQEDDLGDDDGSHGGDEGYADDYAEPDARD